MRSVNDTSTNRWYVRACVHTHIHTVLMSVHTRAQITPALLASVRAGIARRARTHTADARDDDDDEGEGVVDRDVGAHG
jgi:hypothetical protein